MTEKWEGKALYVTPLISGQGTVIRVTTHRCVVHRVRAVTGLVECLLLKCRLHQLDAAVSQRPDLNRT